MSDQTEVTWNVEKLENFKRAYEANKDKEVFVFEGNEFVPGYAKYLIEYLEDRLKTGGAR